MANREGEIPSHPRDGTGETQERMDAEWAWRRRLLPFMVRMVSGLTVFFLVASLAQLVYLQSRIGNAPATSFAGAYRLLETEEPQASDQRLAVFHARAAVDLERHALERRYHQANVQLMARVWMRYLGFLTGMMLALVGAVFILGQLRGSPSEVGGKTAGAEFSVRSASPGIILAVLGVSLMVTTILTRHLVEVTDAPVYVERWGPDGEDHEAEARTTERRPPPLDPLGGEGEGSDR